MPKQMDQAPTSSAQEPVLRDVQRSTYDLSHWSMKVGAMGALQTMSVVKVVAGDSMEMNANFVFRQSPLRRNLYLDCHVDLFAFYVPDRHVYAANAAGSKWEDFIKAGQDEGITLGSDTLAAVASANYNCLGYFLAPGEAFPRWLTRPYIQIWNNFFRDPGDVAGILLDTFFSAGSPTASQIKYGLACCYPKRIWNSAILSTLSSADYSLPLSGGEVNLYELAALKGRLRTDTARDWFSTRYRDLLKHTFDSSVNTDADQRPTLIMRNRTFLSGQDVNGTDDATLGSYSGKSVGLASLRFPSRFFPEHGTLWIMALLRFPPVLDAEWNYLVSKAEPTYAQISGDPELIRRSKPVSLNINEVTESGPSVVLGDTPHSQWYREQSSFSHEDYQTSLGHPFINFNSISTRNDAVYITPEKYDNVYQSLMLKHWNSQGKIDLIAKRFIPDVRDSIFAGSE